MSRSSNVPPHARPRPPARPATGPYPAQPEPLDAKPASETRIYADAATVVELRQWAYEQTSEHSTTDRRLQAAKQIMRWLLGEDQDQPDAS